LESRSTNWKKQERHMKEDTHRSEIINTVEMRNETKEDIHSTRKEFEEEVILENY
jgi:hypothetical protein